MTSPGTEGTARAVVDGSGSGGARLAAPQPGPKQPPAPPKTKSPNIRVAPAVLEAARTDSAALLPNLQTSLAGLTQTQAEERARVANIVKYIRMGASSNFGNMFSVLGACAFLPFLPMAPIQVLTNNLLSDFSQVPIPVDAVDAEQVARPRPWNIAEIRRFLLFIGFISSIFDYKTFGVCSAPCGCRIRRSPRHWD